MHLQRALALHIIQLHLLCSGPKPESSRQAHHSRQLLLRPLAPANQSPSAVRSSYNLLNTSCVHCPCLALLCLPLLGPSPVFACHILTATKLVWQLDTSQVPFNSLSTSQPARFFGNAYVPPVRRKEQGFPEVVEGIRACYPVIVSPCFCLPTEYKLIEGREVTYVSSHFQQPTQRLLQRVYLDL